MIDYALLPPEVNSGRMYTGAGSGPMLAAAASWDRLATTLSLAATSYRTVVTELTDGSWRGPSSVAMDVSAERYAQWMNATAAQAEHTAMQARAAAAAYEAAFAATVPPPVIAANRTELAVLIATNFFGQNFPRIAANQAEYAAMWAQDATAMYGYTAKSAAASVLSPPAPAPQTTNPTSAAAQAAASAQSGTSATTQSGVSDIFSNLPNIFGPINAFLDNKTWVGLSNVASPVGFQFLISSAIGFTSEAIQIIVLPLMQGTGGLAMLSPIAYASMGLGAGLISSTSGGTSAILAGSTGSGVSASLGSAAAIGKLSTPLSWSAAAPEVRLASAALPTAGAATAAPQGAMMPRGFGGLPMLAGPVGGVVNAPKNGTAQARPASSFTAVQQSLGGTKPEEDTENRWAQQDPAASRGSKLSDKEREELRQLHEEMRSLSMECNAMSAMMREVMR